MERIQRGMKRSTPRLMHAALVLSLLFGGTVAFSTVAAPSALADPTCGTVGPPPTNVALAGTSWLGGNGVNIYSNGAEEDTGDDCAVPDVQETVGGKTSGWKWQCVELVNRLYLTMGWITDHWSGNGDTLKDHLRDGLTKQDNGSITSIVPGDVVTFNGNAGNSAGHVAIVSAVSGNSVSIVSQNASGAVTRTITYDPSMKKLSNQYGYTVQDVVHAPANTSTGGGGAGGEGGGGASTNIPAIVARTSTSQDVFFKDTSGNLVDDYWNSTDGWNSTYWADNVAGSPAVASMSSGNMDVVFRDTSNNLIDEWWDSSTGWHYFTLISNGTVRGDPSIAAPTSGGVDIFFRDSSGNLVDVYGNGVSGFSLAYWSINVASDPWVIARTSSNLDVFFKSTSGNLIDQWYQSGVGWNTATLISCGCVSTDATADSRTSDSMDVFYGDSAHNLVDVYWTAAGGWNSTYWGDSVAGRPFVVDRTSSSMDIFFQNTSNQLVDRYWNTTDGWQSVAWSLGVGGSPAAVAPDSGDMDVYYFNTGGGLSEWYWDYATGWNGW